MDKIKILNYLKDSELEIIKNVNYENALVVKVIYKFDDVEINAAKCYANEETDFEEDLDVEVEFVAREIDEDNYGYREFLLAIACEDDDLDIDKIMYDLNI